MLIGDLADLLVTPFRVISVNNGSMPDQTMYDSTESPDFPYDLAFTHVSHVQVAPDGIIEIEYDDDAKPEKKFIPTYVKDLSKKLLELSRDEMTILSAIIDRYPSLSSAIEAVSKCDFYKGVTDWEELAHVYLEEHITIDSELGCDLLDKYFDYSAYGYELETYGNFIETDLGFIKLPD